MDLIDKLADFERRINALEVYEGRRQGHEAVAHSLTYGRVPAKRRASIRAWSVEPGKRSGKWVHLVGVVYDHPRMMNGTLITTSPILKLDIPGRRCETLNTIYDLED